MRTTEMKIWFDKIAWSDFEQPKAGPGGAEGRMPGVIHLPPPQIFLEGFAKYGWIPERE
jgi:hypothetical protein